MVGWLFNNETIDSDDNTSVATEVQERIGSDIQAPIVYIFNKETKIGNPPQAATAHAIRTAIEIKAITVMITAITFAHKPGGVHFITYFMLDDF